jgi:hypothetical protein
VARVEFERHVLKPGLIFKGKGSKPVAFKLWVNRVKVVKPHLVVADINFVTPTAAAVATRVVAAQAAPFESKL